jgi:hypothetical protein
MSINRLLGILEEHKRVTEYRLNSIEQKIDKLSEFKARVIGISLMVSFFATLIVEMLRG